MERSATDQVSYNDTHELSSSYFVLLTGASIVTCICGGCFFFEPSASLDPPDRASPKVTSRERDYLDATGKTPITLPPYETDLHLFPTTPNNHTFYHTTKWPSPVCQAWAVWEAAPPTSKP